MDLQQDTQAPRDEHPRWCDPIECADGTHLSTPLEVMAGDLRYHLQVVRPDGLSREPPVLLSIDGYADWLHEYLGSDDPMWTLLLSPAQARTLVDLVNRLLVQIGQ